MNDALTSAQRRRFQVSSQVRLVLCSSFSTSSHLSLRSTSSSFQSHDPSEYLSFPDERSELTSSVQGLPGIGGQPVGSMVMPGMANPMNPAGLAMARMPMGMMPLAGSGMKQATFLPPGSMGGMPGFGGPMGMGGTPGFGGGLPGALSGSSSLPAS